MRKQLRIVWLAILTVAAVGLIGVDESAALSCGPGPHWIDGCTSPDTDHLNTGAVLGLDLPGDGLWPLDLTQPDVNLVMFGPTTVDRAAASDTSTNFPGAFGSSADFHNDIIDIELVALSLTGGGITVTAGAGLGNGGVLPPSKGVIVEDPSDNTLAQSFFDVFFEVDLGGGLYLYNQIPLTVQSEIDRVPPNAAYHHVITSPIPLYLGFANIGDPDFIFANLVTAQHIVPEPSTAVLLGLGVLGLLSMLRRGAVVSTRQKASGNSHES